MLPWKGRWCALIWADESIESSSGTGCLDPVWMKRACWRAWAKPIKLFILRLAKVWKSTSVCMTYNSTETLEMAKEEVNFITSGILYLQWTKDQETGIYCSLEIHLLFEGSRFYFILQARIETHFSQWGLKTPGCSAVLYLCRFPFVAPVPALISVC